MSKPGTERGAINWDTGEWVTYGIITLIPSTSCRDHGTCNRCSHRRPLSTLTWNGDTFAGECNCGGIIS